MRSKYEHEVGDVVYEPYVPSKLYIVREVKQVTNGSGQTWPTYRCEDKDGNEDTLAYLRSYQDLIDDHEKKLRNHKKKMAEFVAKVTI